MIDPHPGDVATPAAPRRRDALAVAGGLLLLVALLGAAVLTRWTPLLELDLAVSRRAYAGDGRPLPLDLLLEALTAPGLTVVRLLVLLPVAGWLVRRDHTRTAVWVAVTALVVGPLTAGLKELVGRVRPELADGGDRYTSLSFPSGHSSGIATLVAVLLLLAWPRLTATARRRAVVAGAALAVLVALTRLWLGVHYLSDVVAGLALGTAWTLLTAVLLGALPGGPAALPPRGRAP